MPSLSGSLKLPVVRHLVNGFANSFSKSDSRSTLVRLGSSPSDSQRPVHAHCRQDKEPVPNFEMRLLPEDDVEGICATREVTLRAERV